MDIELAAKELKMLASRDRLLPSQLDRAKDLMVQLKSLGMANPEIVELTGGRWSESTVKGYTKGVRATDPEPWKSTTALFSEMVSRNLTLDQVSRAMTITAELEAMGTSLGDMVSFMQDLKERQTTLSQLSEAINTNAQLERMGTSSTEIGSLVQELQQENVDTPSFVLLFHDWHGAGLTAADARSALNYKRDLEGASFDINTLSQIAEAAGKLGNPPEVLEALVKYGTLGELNEGVETKRKELDTLATEIESRNQELDAASQKLQEVQNEAATIEKALQTYRRLEAMGFDEKALQELAKATDKYGGPRKILTAVNSFGDFSQIKVASEEMQGKLQQQRTTLKDLEDKHSHLKSAIEMCQKLLRDYKFGLDAITTLLATAKMYGDPIKVLKAVESYGKRQTKDEEARQLEARIEQLKKTESQYESRNKAILDQFETLNAKAIEVGRTVGTVEEQLKGNIRARDILTLLQNPMAAGYDDYAMLVLPLAKSIRIWVSENKSKFSLCYRIDEGLEALVESLGGS